MAILCDRSPLTSIQAVQDKSLQRRLLNAYSFLVQCPNSDYSYFVKRYDHDLFHRRLYFYNLFRISHVETALWPIWYYNDSLCESAITQDQHSKHSKKRQFMWKCLSLVFNYSLDFNLLQFQYERWLYQIVSGSIDSGKKYNLCPTSVLSQKPFCNSFWRWQHALLIDAVDRLGYPDFFLP